MNLHFLIDVLTAYHAKQWRFFSLLVLNIWETDAKGIFKLIKDSVGFKKKNPDDTVRQIMLMVEVVPSPSLCDDSQTDLQNPCPNRADAN